MNVSVAMATYNGEKYIDQQIESILKQLNENDELVISDDNSKDKTIEIINSFVDKDSRVKVYFNKKKGVISNFENAISLSTKDIIFLCDQDDVWLDNKVQTIKNYFLEEKLTLVVSDAKVVDTNLNVINDSFYKMLKSRKGIVKNIAKNTYIGSAMAFRSELKERILPIPNNVPMHDAWIGIIAEKYGHVKFIPEKLFLYRRHDSVATTYDASLIKKLQWRKNLVIELYKRYSLLKK